MVKKIASRSPSKRQTEPPSAIATLREAKRKIELSRKPNKYNVPELSAERKEAHLKKCVKVYDSNQISVKMPETRKLESAIITLEAEAELPKEDSITLTARRDVRVATEEVSYERVASSSLEDSISEAGRQKATPLEPKQLQSQNQRRTKQWLKDDSRNEYKTSLEMNDVTVYGNDALEATEQPIFNLTGHLGTSAHVDSQKVSTKNMSLEAFSTGQQIAESKLATLPDPKGANG